MTRQLMQMVNLMTAMRSRSAIKAGKAVKTVIAPVLFLASAGCGEKLAQAHVDRLSDPDSQVRLEASYKLIDIGSPAVLPLLEKARTGSDSLQYIAAQIFGRIGDGRAVPFLLDAAKDDNPHVRREALLALGMMDLPDLAEPIAKILRAEVSDSVRAAAVESLANLRDTTVVPDLIRSLSDSAAVVRRHALAGLNRRWTDAAGDAAIRALSDEDETVRYLAAQLLGTRSVARAAPSLRLALLDSSEWVRTEAAHALAKLGDLQAVDDLVDLLRIRNGPDSEAARQALFQLTGDEYVVVNQAPSAREVTEEP